MDPKLAFMMIRKFGDRAPLLTDKLYYMLSEQIAKVESTDAFLDQVMEEHEVCEKLLLQISNIKPASARVEIIHKLIDEEMEDARREATCRKGCTACCYLNVDITNDEARVLKRLLKPGDEKKLRKQAKVKNTEEHPYQLSYEDAKCVFLKDGECSVYDKRPISCRTHFSASEAILCDTQVHPRGKVSLYVDRKVELFKTIMYKLYGCAPMAKQLLKK